MIKSNEKLNEIREEIKTELSIYYPTWIWISTICFIILFLIGKYFEV